MSLLVVLVPAEHDELSLGPAAVEALARLGVTSVSLARDDRVAALVLEGWAFDASRPDAAVAALGAMPYGAQALQPVMQVAVTAEGGMPLS
jgi:hypothetical protein